SHRTSGNADRGAAGARRSARASHGELRAGARRVPTARHRRIALVTPPRGSHAVEPPQFRQLLGRFATGVTVLTSRKPNGELIGMTASSVASVSLDPPLVLVSVDKQHDMHAALEGGTHF